MASSAETDVGQMSFEAALARLEEIVRTLEKGEAPLDQSIELYQEGDREALIVQLRAEREQHVRDAEAALAAASGEDLRDEVVPGIRDPFKSTPVE